MFRRNNKVWHKGLVWKASNVASHQTRWYNKRILRKSYSVPREFSWIGITNWNNDLGIKRAVHSIFWPILSQCFISIPLKMSENQRFFLTFSRGMKMDLWLRMGWKKWWQFKIASISKLSHNFWIFFGSKPAWKRNYHEPRQHWKHLFHTKIYAKRFIGSPFLCKLIK